MRGRMVEKIAWFGGVLTGAWHLFLERRGVAGAVGELVLGVIVAELRAGGVLVAEAEEAQSAWMGLTCECMTLMFQQG